MNRLIHTLGQLERFALSVKDVVWRLTTRDRDMLLLILFCAALLRMLMLEHPGVTQFDEVIYTNYALHMLHQTPLMDIHPPLVRMLFAEIARPQGPFQIEWIPIAVGQSFGDFPYVFVRFFVSCFGVLLPLLVYGISRALGSAPRVALLPALFVVFDSALVVYSRTILPDTLLLCFEFAALLAALCLVRTKDKRLVFTLIILTGITIGCALSTKWTALGMFGVITLLLLMHKRFVSLAAVGVLAALVYVGVFVAFFNSFPMGGKTVSPISTIAAPWIKIIDFPKPESLSAVLNFLPSYHKAMLAAEYDPYVLHGTLKAPGAYSWPAAQSMMQFWSDQDDVASHQVHLQKGGSYILMAGNSFLWVTVLFAFIFECGWIFINSLMQRKIMANKYELLLIIGYLANFMPFFFIHRPMYLYHYFTALLFLFLLVPYALPRIRHCIELVTRDKWFSYVFIAAALMLVVINFIINLPVTYGFLW